MTDFVQIENKLKKPILVLPYNKTMCRAVGRPLVWQSFARKEFQLHGTTKNLYH